MKFCTSSPCMDENYAGNNDYPHAREHSGKEAFYDELARFETLMQDAFDRADSTQRFSYSPSNGDVFQHPMGSRCWRSPRRAT